MSAVEVVTKIDAARRQLATAIDLWFNDKDAVSIHTLAYAAYDVIHGLSKRRGRKQSLIMDYEGKTNISRCSGRLLERPGTISNMPTTTQMKTLTSILRATSSSSFLQSSAWN